MNLLQSTLPLGWLENSLVKKNLTVGLICTKKKTKNLPPIKDLYRGGHEKAFEVLYMKGGPLILNDLEEQIGIEKFSRLLINVYNKNVDKTDELLDVLYDMTNQDIVDRFNNLLHK